MPDLATKLALDNSIWSTYSQSSSKSLFLIISNLDLKTPLSIDSPEEDLPSLIKSVNKKLEVSEIETLKICSYKPFAKMIVSWGRYSKWELSRIFMRFFCFEKLPFGLILDLPTDPYTFWADDCFLGKIL